MKRFALLWPSAVMLAGCVVFEAPADGGQPRDAGTADGGVKDAGADDAGADAGSDAGVGDAGSDAGPPGCVVASIMAYDACAGDIVVNEVDGSGSGNADFVEIYNRGSSPVDISDYVITDGTMDAPNVASGVVVPAGTVLDPGRFVYVWANLETAAGTGWQTDNCMPGAPTPCLHSSWGIGASGDFIHVLDDSLTIVCTLQYPSGVFAAEAFGRVDDGAAMLCPTDPTPGETNVRSSVR